MSKHQVPGAQWLVPCQAQWAYTKGWRMWRDRFLYGHVQHRCARTHVTHTPNGRYEVCTCACGSHLPSPWKDR